MSRTACWRARLKRNRSLGSCTVVLAPTTERNLQAEMYEGLTLLGEHQARYQFQTWGGTRPPEGRITDIAPIHSRSSEDDILLLQRQIDSTDRYRMILVKQNTAEYQSLALFIAGRRWGPLKPSNPPVSQNQLAGAATEIISHQNAPFQLLTATPTYTLSVQQRVARKLAFRLIVREQYQNRCAVSGSGISALTGIIEVEAAHIVPISESGADDVRNGISLSRSLHWAFDRGLFGIDAARRVTVPTLVQQRHGNQALASLHGAQITEAAHVAHRAHDSAFQWHMQNKVSRWL